MNCLRRNQFNILAEINTYYQSFLKEFQANLHNLTVGKLYRFFDGKIIKLTENQWRTQGGGGTRGGAPRRKKKKKKNGEKEGKGEKIKKKEEKIKKERKKKEKKRKKEEKKRIQWQKPLKIKKVL